jgi:hypothetical protein
VAGATGAIGKQQVPRLVAAGDLVHGRTRSESKQAMLHELGAVLVVADAVLMTELRGASNAMGKRELGWRPGHPGWRPELAA